MKNYEFLRMRAMRSLFLTLLAMLLALPAAADNIDVADANGNTLRFSYENAENGVASVTSIVSYSADAEKAKHIVIPSQITGADERLHTVTAVGYNAFNAATSVVSITLPASLTSLGERAFYGCSALESISIPEGVTTIQPNVFSGCTSLTSATLHDGITSIKADAFYNTGLTSFVAPAALTTIGGEAFGSCTALEEIDLSKATGLTSIGDYAFHYCSAVKRLTINSDFTNTNTYIASSANLESVTFGNNATTILNSFLSGKTKLTSVTLGTNIQTIGYSAFNGCSALASITLPASLTSLGERAFYGCSALESISIPEGVTTIQPNVFSGCTSLTSATLHDGITSIKADAFYNTGLTSFVAPAALTTIGGEAFGSCTALEEIDLSKATGLTSIGDYAFHYCSAVKRLTINSDFTNTNTYIASSANLESVTFGNNATTIFNSFLSGKTKLTSVTIGTGVQSIGSNAFQNCDALTSITIPDGVTSLGERAFSDCDALTSVVVGNGLPSIPYACFYSCDKLETVTLGTGIKTINAEAFEYCYALSSINLEDTQLETLNGSDIFYNCNALLELTMPATLQTVSSSYTLRNINNLRKLTILAAEVPFTNTTNLPSQVVLYIPAAYVDTYKANQFTSGYRIIALGLAMDFDIATTAGGQLQEKVEEIGQASNVMSLKVTGPINGTDIEYMHRYLTSLQHLDLGEANIVNGGESYHIYDVANNGTATQSGSNSYNTQADIVGDYMFYNMPMLESFVMPQAATKLGYYSVGGNLKRLTTITLPAALEEIGECAFAQPYNYNKPSCSNSIRQMTIPAGVTKIGVSAFSRCLMQELTIPAGVTRIEDATFYNSALTKVNFSDNITYIGADAFRYGSLQSLTLPTQLETIGTYAFANNEALEGKVTIPSGVKAIPTYAFNTCTKLDSIALEDGVETIGNSAFSFCKRLTNVALPTSLTHINNDAFYQDDMLESITIPESVEAIGTNAFGYNKRLRSFAFPANVKTVSNSILSYCDSLQSVTLAEGTTSIGSSAFRDCYKLTSCNINQSTLTNINQSAFYNTGFESVTLPNSITSLGSEVFMSCANLQSINVPTGIDYTPYRFVRGCSKLTSVQMHDGIRTIGTESFYGCYALPSIELNNNITNINNDAFRGCTILQIGALPTALTEIGSSAFNGCKAITSVTVPAGVVVRSSAFAGSGLLTADISQAASIESYVFDGCASLNSITWNNSWTKIPNCTFRNCASLLSFPFYDGLKTIDNSAFENAAIREVVISGTVETINNYAFENCKRLQSVSMLLSLRTIGSSAFYGCDSLESVTVPDSVTSVGNYAFAYCPRLKVAHLGRSMNYPGNSSFDYFFQNENMELLRVYAGTVPPISSYYAPKNRANCVLEVPMGTEELYATADVWKEFKEIRGFLTGDKLAAEDYAILCQFYNEMGGENWTRKWDLTTDDRYIGKWYGVTTEGDHVKTIAVTSNNLTGDLRETIFTLPEVTSINLSNNAITGHLENVLGETYTNDKIESVSLNSNMLEGDIAPFANKLTNLTSISLAYNRLTAISEPLSNKLANNSNSLDYRYQFADPVTCLPITTADYPTVQVKLGEPFSIPNRTIYTYRHYYKDYNYNGDRLYELPRYQSGSSYYFSANGYYIFTKNNEGMFVPGTGYAFKGYQKGENYVFDIGGEEWGKRTVVLNFDWIDGDVNQDLTVDVLDLQSVAHYALYDTRISNQPLNYVTADANSDNAIDIRDAVLTVNRILNYEDENASLARTLYNIMSEDTDAATVSIAEGSLRMTNAEGATAMQFMLTGCTEDDICLSSDLVGFSMKARQTKQGVKVIVYNFNDESLDANEHDILTNLPEGTQVADVRLSNEMAERTPARIVGSSVVGVNTNTLSETDASGLIYDMEGRIVAKGSLSDELRRLPAGTYILCVEGKTLKVTKK